MCASHLSCRKCDLVAQGTRPGLRQEGNTGTLCSVRYALSHEGLQIRRSSFMKVVNESYNEKAQGKLDGYVVVSDAQVKQLLRCALALGTPPPPPPPCCDAAGSHGWMACSTRIVCV